MTTTGWSPRNVGWLHQVRWLVVPFALALFVLVGLAVSTESRQSYQETTTEPAGAANEPLPDQTDQPEQQPLGGATDLDATDLDRATDPGGGTDPTATVEVGIGTQRVGLELGGPDPVATPTDEAGALTGSVVLDGETEGSGDGLRLTEDGGFEPIDASTVGADDIVVDPSPGDTDGGQGQGIDLLRPNGGRIEIRPGGDGLGGLSITEQAADGSSRELQPDASGAIELDDGLRLQVSTDEADAETPAEEPTDDPGAAGQTEDGEGDGEDGAGLSPWERVTDTWLRWAVLAVLAIVAAVVLGLLQLRRRVPEEPFGPDFVGQEGIPIERFDEFVAMLQADTDPDRAVRLAFHAAERGLGTLPSRRSDETPFEWCGRAAEGDIDAGRPLRSLADRFATVRFSPDPATPADQAQAIADLVAIHRHAVGDAGGRTVSEPVAAGR